MATTIKITDINFKALVKSFEKASKQILMFGISIKDATTAVNALANASKRIYFPKRGKRELMHDLIVNIRRKDMYLFICDDDKPRTHLKDCFGFLFFTIPCIYLKECFGFLYYNRKCWSKDHWGSTK